MMVSRGIRRDATIVLLFLLVLAIFIGCYVYHQATIPVTSQRVVDKHSAVIIVTNTIMVGDVPVITSTPVLYYYLSSDEGMTAIVGATLYRSVRVGDIVEAKWE